METGAIILQHLHLKIKSGRHARENPFEETISGTKLESYMKQ